MSRILLVDSSEKISEFIIRCLTRNGFDVMHMPDSIGIQLKVRFSPLDLIIIDSEIKNESGFDVCRRLKQLDETKYIPVLIMGYNESSGTVMRALEAGADDYIVKNFDESVLISKVKSLMRIKHLSDQLIQQYTELEEKNKILELQLNMAMKVQRSLIQEHNISHNDVRFVSKYMPALEIGGDFYDIVQLDDDSVSVVMGDVSGHGISAALLTAMLQMMIRNLAPKYYNPAQFLYHMNNEFVNIFESVDSQMYACMFYAVINTKKRRIYYSNAGQALPFFVSSETESVFELESNGTPIGMIRDSVYDNNITVYDKDDMILFYTDGLSDNLYKDNADEFYSRLRSQLLDMRLNHDPNAIINSVLDVFYVKDVSTAAKYEMDDVSLILCKM